jgi:cupin superfamily acireductone dioxygenase involved in methionine salvage/enamine deaminase RidA (YjgF/YER057c/UK114 family)
MSACGCQAWIYHEDPTQTKFALHQGPTPTFLSHDDLAKIGVIYHKMEEKDQDPKLTILRKERGYTEHDYVTLNKDIPQEKFDIFFDEHLHEDEEIRLCIDGSGFFDLRTADDTKWIRVHCHPGDLIIVPAGIYHRFTLDENMYIKAMRLFTSAPMWVPHSRTQEETEGLQSRSEFKLFLEKHAFKNGLPVIVQDGPQSLANYPHARIINNMIYLSGFSSRRSDNTHRGAVKNDETGQFDLDIYEQTIGVIENMKATLKQSHPKANLENLVDITIFLTDMEHYKRMNEAYNIYFKAETGPSRTCVAVKQLPHANLLIEIKGVATLPQ